MELVYVWIENYGCIQNKEMHFSSVLNINFDVSTKQLTLSKNEKALTKFWASNIHSLHTLVGGNGSGKTTVMKLIARLATGQYMPEMGNIIIVRYDSANKKPFVLSSFPIHISTSIDVDEKDLTPNHGTAPVYKPIYKSEEVIYINNHFEMVDFTNPLLEPIMDFSKGSLMHKDHVSGSVSDDRSALLNHQNASFKRKLDFIVNFMTGEDHGHGLIKLPSRIEFRIQKSEHIEEAIIERLGRNRNDEEKTNLRNLFKEFTAILKRQKGKPNSNHFTEQLNYHCIINALHEILIEPTRTSTYTYSDRVSSFIRYMGQFKSSNSLRNVLTDLTQYIEKNLKLEMGTLNLSNYDAFITYLYSPSFQNMLVSFDCISPYTGSTDLTLDKISELREWFNVYSIVNIQYDFLTFDWGLSTGEMNFLTFYSDLYAGSENLKNDMARYNQIENILILIDEADLSYHPSLQLKYVNHLLNMLPRIFTQQSIQVVLSTHSPLLLTDIPRQCVTYLGSEEDQQQSIYDETFGQNVYELFKHAFILKDTIGVFARKKINETVKFISQSETLLDKRVHISEIRDFIATTELNKHFQIVSLIGDPVIQGTLEKKLENLKSYIQTDLPDEQLIKVEALYNELNDYQKEKLIELLLEEAYR